MTEEQNYFVALCRAAVFEEAPPSPPRNLDWQWMWDKAAGQNISGLLASALERLPEGERPGDYDRWYMSMLQTALLMGDRLDELDRMLDVLKRNGLEPVCLKGAAIKNLYGENDAVLRTMGDFDILVKKDMLPRIKEIFLSEGYSLTDERVGLTASKGSFSWDIFYTLEEEFRNLCEKYDAAITETAVRYDGMLCPCPTYMLTHLILHLGKHLTGEGAGIRNLLDMAVYIGAFGSGIDYGAVRSICAELNMENVYVYVLNALNKYFGFDLKIEEKEPEKFVALMLDGGIFGEGKSNVLLSQVSKRGDVGIFRRLFFPPVSMLEESYKYLHRFPWLLPAAWVHRFFYAVFHRGYGVKKMYSDLRGSVEFAKKHDKTMEELGL